MRSASASDCKSPMSPLTASLPQLSCISADVERAEDTSDCSSFFIPLCVSNDGPSNERRDAFESETLFESLYVIKKLFGDNRFLYRTFCRIYGNNVYGSGTIGVVDYNVWKSGVALFFKSNGRVRISLCIFIVPFNGHEILRLQCTGNYMLKNTMLRFMDFAADLLWSEFSSMSWLSARKDGVVKFTLCPACLNIARSEHSKDSRQSSDDCISGSSLTYNESSKDIVVYQNKKVGLFNEEYRIKIKKQLEMCESDENKLRNW
jgi:hypothetical protein